MASPAKRVIIITGAAQGLGAAIATRLAKDGFDLGLFDLPQCRELLEALATNIRQESGCRVFTVYGDVSVEGDVKNMIDDVAGQLGDLYAMIANAGVGSYSIMHETSNEILNQTIDVDFKGVFFCYKYAVARMIAQGKGGRIIGAASTASKRAVPGQSIYCAMKFAVRGLTQCTAMENAKYGITANTYCPGAVETPMMDKVDAMMSLHTGQPLGSFRNSRGNAVERSVTPEDVANLVSFLASDGAGMITGQSYNIDGGVVFE